MRPVQPEPTRPDRGPAAQVASTHDHPACPGCVCAMDAINRLQDDLRRARGRADAAEHRNGVLEDQIARMGAAPEMGRRKWEFGGQEP